jgi:hypothetical protein
MIGALTEYVAEVRAQRFKPGSHDCGLFIAGWVQRATGFDPAANLRGKYRTLKRAQELLEADGFDDHVAYVRSLFPSVPVAFAQPGDLAVVDGNALGIVAGETVYVLDLSGLASVPLTRASVALRIEGTTCR